MARAAGQRRNFDAANGLGVKPQVKARLIELMLLQRTEKVVGGWRPVARANARWLRAIALKTAGSVHLQSRNGEDFNGRYQTIVQALVAILNETAIDGEIVFLDTAGRPLFSALQNHDAGTPIYYAFDVMILAGKDVMNKPLSATRPAAM